MNRFTSLLLAAVVATGAGAGIAAAAGYGSSGGTVTLHKTKLGSILANSKGVTLYLFEKDKNHKSACSGACAAAWPPLLTTGKPTAGSGVKASLLGTTKRSDGKTQVTYAGHPVYTFSLDKGKAGSTKGEGNKAFGAEWYVLNAKGKKVEG